MTESKDNQENNWENETELHLMDVCPLFIAPDSWYQDLVPLPSGGIVTRTLEF